MNDMSKRVRWSRRLDYVPRWSVVPTVNKQVVSAHSFQVAQITRWLLQYHVNGSCPDFYMQSVCYALDHDVDEAANGDAPTPSKLTSFPDKADQVRVLVKVADILEAMVFLQEEMLMGNEKRIRPIYEELGTRLHLWFHAFEWDAPFRKPLTSDLARMLMDAIYPPPFHPAMEPRK